jgi:hypothetical protein
MDQETIVGVVVIATASVWSVPNSRSTSVKLVDGHNDILSDREVFVCAHSP